MFQPELALEPERDIDHIPLCELFGVDLGLHLLLHRLIGRLLDV